MLQRIPGSNAPALEPLGITTPERGNERGQAAMLLAIGARNSRTACQSVLL
jgi:hypothetical protein